jgi:hypothetical protein
MGSRAPVEAPGRPDEQTDELRDDGVVSVEPGVREAISRHGPAPAARWRILAYKWFVLIRRTD